MRKNLLTSFAFFLIVCISIFSFGLEFNSLTLFTKAAPVVDFSFDNNNTCSGTPITFTPTVTGDAPFTYDWDFGNGDTSIDSNPTYSFIELGCTFQDRDITLTVTDANGLSASVTKTISIQQKPELSFANLNAPTGSTAPFEKCGDNNTDTDYTVNVDNNSASITCITSYNIDWGDGNTINNVTFPQAHTYTQLGSFNMTITAIGDSDCNNSITYVVKNSNNPIGALVTPGNTTNLCLPVDPMEFAIGSWALNPSDTNYRVNYGDGTVVNYTQAQLESSPYYNASNPPASEDFPIPHTFTRFNCPGGNVVTLVISTSCGQSILTAGPIIILDAPTTAFSAPNIACANTNVYFDNNTIAGYANDCSTNNVYTWDFGDGSPTSSAVNPSHVYTTPGTYTVTLSSVTPCGVGATVSRTICVEPILQPDFTFNNACASTPFQITNTTDTSQSCGTETYRWEITNYIEAYCGEEPEQWHFSNGTNWRSKDPVINFVTPGIYYLRLTTRNSCGIDKSIIKRIDVKKPPVTTLESISNFCQSATIHPTGTVEETCSPSSEITYSWSFPGGTPATSNQLDPGQVTYSASGSYTVTFSVSNSCGTTTKTQTFTVDLDLSPIITPKNVEICSGDTFVVNPTDNITDNVPNGTTYTWRTPVVTPAGAVTGASAQNSPKNNISQTLTNNTNTPATVVYTVSPISGSCPGPDFTVTVVVNPIIKVDSAIINNTCFESDDASINITVTGGTPHTTGNPYTISWIGPNGFTSSNEDISNLEPGNYYLSITDDGDCPFSQTFTVTEPGEFRMSSNKTDISCFGEDDGQINLNVFGGTQPYVFSWTKDGVPFSTNEDLNSLEPGAYEVTVAEANNCGILTESFTIIEPPLLEVSLVSKVDILCYGDYTGEIYVNVVGGRAIEISPGIFNYSYYWTGPNGFTSFNKDLTNVAAGTYNLTVTDNSGCTDTLEVVLNQNPQIQIEYTITEIICYNDDSGGIEITNIYGGVPPYTIAWSNLGSGMIQTNLSAGIYTITITDSLDCVRAFPINIENAPIFDINPDIQQISCYGQNDGSIKLNLIGGEAPVDLVWDDDPTAGDERNNIGPGTYTVTITDAKSCVITDTFIIVEPEELLASASVTDALDCDEVNVGAIDLFVEGGTLPLTIRWSNGATTEDLTDIGPGLYTVTITDANSCELVQTYEVKRFEPLEAPIEVITNYDCDTRYVDQTFIAHVEGGIPPYQLSWSSGTISGANNEIMKTEENGLVILTVTDSFGCTKDFSINVDTPVLGDADFELSSIGMSVYNLWSIQDPIQFTNLATGDFVGISWDFGDGNFSDEENPLHSYVNEGTYTIKQTVTYPFGCQYSTTMTIVLEKGYSLIMPNAFTPNNDGINDYFTPSFLGLSSMQLNIYDTWGEIVYSEDGEDIRGWNGTVRDVKAENGNYYYRFIAKTFYGATVTKEGPIVLIN